MKRTFEALATVVSLVVDDDVPDAELAWMLVAGYPDSSSPAALQFHVRCDALICEGQYETRVEDPTDLVPLLELDLYHSLIERAPSGWLLHAAAVERDRGAIVLAGVSGAGKTTLTLALVARGWRMCTEEIVHVDRGAIVRGLARPIHAVAGSHAVPAEWPHRPYRLRGPRGQVGVLVQPPVEIRSRAPLPLRAFARIEHGPDLEPSANRLPAAAALPRLWECTLRQDDDGLAVATVLLGTCPAFELRSRSVAEAVKLVERIAAIENH